MLNDRQLGKSIKYLAMSSETIKHHFGYASDSEAFEHSLRTLPESFPIKELKTTCPQEGKDSLKNKVLSSMKKLEHYKPASPKLTKAEQMTRDQLEGVVNSIISWLPCASSDFAVHLPNILLEYDLITQEAFDKMIQE